MDAAALRDHIRAHFSRTAFRLETLQQYEVASDGSDFARYLAGEAEPTPERKQPWLDRLRSERRRGLQRSRVRLVTHPVTDYTRYEWAELYGADEAQRAELVGWAESLRPQWLDSRLIMQRGTNHFQERIRRIEEASALVRSYQAGLVLGSLQTEAYATAVFSGRPTVEAAAAVSARMRRHRMMLEDPHRAWTLIQTEGALLWHVGGPTLMAEQLDRMVEASTRPNIRLGVITHRTPVSFTAGHGFHIYDRQAVQIGTRTATALTSDHRDVEAYEALFAELERVAAFGDEARTILSDLADRYRRLETHS